MFGGDVATGIAVHSTHEFAFEKVGNDAFLGRISPSVRQFELFVEFVEEIANEFLRVLLLEASEHGLQLTHVAHKVARHYIAVIMR
jgi:hypothetical protein